MFSPITKENQVYFRFCAGSLSSVPKEHLVVEMYISLRLLSQKVRACFCICWHHCWNLLGSSIFSKWIGLHLHTHITGHTHSCRSNSSVLPFSVPLLISLIIYIWQPKCCCLLSFLRACLFTIPAFFFSSSSSSSSSSSLPRSFCRQALQSCLTCGQRAGGEASSSKPSSPFKNHRQRRLSLPRLFSFFLFSSVLFLPCFLLSLSFSFFFLRPVCAHQKSPDEGGSDW